MIKKVIILKDIESNIIEEAVLTLKDGVNLDNNDEKRCKSKYACVVKEAEGIVEECMYKLEEQNVQSKLKRFLSKIFNIKSSKMNKYY